MKRFSGRVIEPVGVLCESRSILTRGHRTVKHGQVHSLILDSHLGWIVGRFLNSQQAQCSPAGACLLAQSSLPKGNTCYFPWVETYVVLNLYVLSFHRYSLDMVSQPGPFLEARNTKAHSKPVPAL